MFLERGGLTRRLVHVLVLESGHAERWSIGVWEYRSKSEKHPRSGLEMLKGRGCSVVSRGPTMCRPRLITDSLVTDYLANPKMTMREEGVLKL